MENSIHRFQSVLMMGALVCTRRSSALVSSNRLDTIAFIAIVMVMLGGAWVPSFIFPRWLRNATLVIPTRWAMDGLDAMVWRGLGFSAAVGPIAVLLVSALLFGVLAVARFRGEAEG